MRLARKLWSLETALSVPGERRTIVGSLPRSVAVSRKALHDKERHLGERMHRGILKDLGYDPGQGAPILQHVAESRRVAEVVVLYLPLPLWTAANAGAAQVQKSIPGSRQADGRQLIIRARQHCLQRNHSSSQDFLFSIHVREEALEGAQALLKPAHDQRPVFARENVRQKVATPWFASPRIVPQQIESYAHLAEDCLHSLTERPPVRQRHIAQILKHLRELRARRAIRAKDFVPA
jgi:hypothetical protein